MADQKCPDCGANMLLLNNRDGTISYLCKYCGKRFDVQPVSTSDKLFAFAKRAINAINERREEDDYDPYLDQHIATLRKKLETASGKERAKLEKRLEKDLQYREACHRARR